MRAQDPHQDQSIATACGTVLAHCAECPCGGNGPSTPAAMDVADQQLLATLFFPTDAADDGAMPVEAAEDLLQRLTVPGARLVAVADSDMIGVIVDRQSDTVLSDRPMSSGPEPQQA